MATLLAVLLSSCATWTSPLHSKPGIPQESQTQSWGEFDQHHLLSLQRFRWWLAENVLDGNQPSRTPDWQWARTREGAPGFHWEGGRNSSSSHPSVSGQHRSIYKAPSLPGTARQEGAAGRQPPAVARTQGEGPRGRPPRRQSFWNGAFISHIPSGMLCFPKALLAHLDSRTPS